MALVQNPRYTNELTHEHEGQQALVSSDASTTSFSESMSPSDCSSDDEMHGLVVCASDSSIIEAAARSTLQDARLARVLAAAKPAVPVRSESEFYAVHPAVVVRHAGPLGFGLFTTKALPAGTCVYFEKECCTPEGGGHAKIEDFKTWSPERLEDYMVYAWQVDEVHYSGYTSIALAQLDASSYLNHSCDPNVWWSDRADNKLVARRDLEAGEEICLDYATVESMFFSERGPQSGCLCNSARCRGRINGDDYLKPELIERYGNHWMGYMLERRGIKKPYDDFEVPEWLGD
eukprot:c33010_g1_i1.p1 GENE.c33010_g1_i1~~c33010_g1_i1.p1  ORF type:complete len:290 (+),score=53.40 c33010_g1_i1:78-947(+)